MTIKQISDVLFKEDLITFYFYKRCLDELINMDIDPKEKMPVLLNLYYSHVEVKTMEEQINYYKCQKKLEKYILDLDSSYHKSKAK